jgi:long-subunit fatty acid transport protein
MIMFRLISLLWFVLIIFISNSYAYEINDKFSVGGVLAGAYQYQWVDGDENLGRGALPF